MTSFNRATKKKCRAECGVEEIPPGRRQPTLPELAPVAERAAKLRVAERAVKSVDLPWLTQPTLPELAPVAWVFFNGSSQSLSSTKRNGKLKYHEVLSSTAPLQPQDRAKARGGHVEMLAQSDDNDGDGTEDCSPESSQVFAPKRAFRARAY